MTNEELWKTVLEQMELTVSKANFITWFKPTKLISRENGAVRVSVPSGFIKEWLQNKFSRQILNSLRNLSPDIKEVNFIVGIPNEGMDRLKVDEEYLSKQEVVREINTFDIDKATNLNNKYLFETFVVGGNNELAFAASQAIIKNLGKIYNPLFIYGGIGLGKTHLLQAVGNKLIKEQKNIKILYIPSEKMVAEVIEAVRNRTIENLKQKYSLLDILIVDDIQFIAGKETTQDIFFAIFNTLYNKNKQIILSSDRPVKAIPAIEERLRSRFEGGMIADIGLPNFETRLTILNLKVKNKNFSTSKEILEYIATNIQKNIRELEGALNRVIAFSQITNKDLTLKDVERLLTAYLNAPFRRAGYQIILKCVSEFYEIPLSDIIKRSRKKEIVRPRQIAMHLLREDSKLSFPEIGIKLGGRDHSTVIHACEKIKKEEAIDEIIRQELTLIRERVYTALNINK